MFATVRQHVIDRQSKNTTIGLDNNYKCHFVKVPSP